MTDRYAGFIVTLAEDQRSDDAEDVMTALRLVRGVVSVEPVVADSDLHIATMRVRSELRARLFEVLS